jgi:hypothetical protein
MQRTSLQISSLPMRSYPTLRNVSNMTNSALLDSTLAEELPEEVRLVVLALAVPALAVPALVLAILSAAREDLVEDLAAVSTLKTSFQPLPDNKAAEEEHDRTPSSKRPWLATTLRFKPVSPLWRLRRVPRRQSTSPRCQPAERVPAPA